MIHLYRFLVVWLGCLCTQVLADELLLYTSNNGSFSYCDGGELFAHKSEDITGTAVQFVKDMLDASGVPYRIKLRNQAVGIRRASMDANSGFFVMGKREHLLDQFIWIGPIARDVWGAYKNRQSPVNVNSVSELAGYRLGGQKGHAVVSFLEESGIDVSVELEDRVNPYRLNHNLIDFWVTSQSSAYKLAFESGFTEIMQAIQISHEDLYLVLNLNVDREIVEKLEASYKDMLQEGRQWQ